ncbi:MAG: TonB-dependent receptor [Rhizobiales bacterium]|nr:TonB-dependent receptor [Hyphomicrobiales bacterium]
MDRTFAQTPPPESSSLPQIVVTSPEKKRAKQSKRAEPQPPPSTSNNIGSQESAAPQAASEKTFTNADVNAVPVTRPGEALEVTPGLIVTQHSGEGKANQYFLRGFNLDHGTDLAITIDGMPANMRTHGHGQGYADINFMIPELIQSVQVKKGPYYADEGDFLSAGAIHIDYLNKIDRAFAEISLGSFGYRRALVAGSGQAGNGTVLTAIEANSYNGPWAVPDNIRKLNGVLRYSEGNFDNGLSITGMAYRNGWTSTDQVGQRAIDQGTIDRFGTLNPTDGGNAERYSLSARFRDTDAAGGTKVDAFAIRSSLQLFNDFTYFLDDPVNGDQISQTDRRTVLGVNASHTFNHRFGMLPMETTFGVQTRYDDIDVGLFNTVDRQITGVVREDHVKEGSAGVYAQNLVRWAPWLRTTTGIRYDVFNAQVNSDAPANSGNVTSGIASPKFGIVLGPFAATEFFANAGTGMHSNDARGATITVDPVNGTPLDKSPLLVRSKGAEVGVRTKIVRGLESSVALFVLDFDSELLFVGDAGTTEPSRPSRRVGVEWTNRYRVNSWLAFDADIAATKARFTDFDPAGNYIPGAANLIGSASIVFGEKLGWFGAVKLRYFGPRPLIEDNSVQSLSSSIVNARLGYNFDNGVRFQIDAINLFNAKTNQIEYYYESRLQTEAAGVFDRHVHPVEPLAVRASLRVPLQ